MLDVVRELVDAVDRLKGLPPGRPAELHALLDQAAQDLTGPPDAKHAAKADVPA